MVLPGNSQILLFAQISYSLSRYVPSKKMSTAVLMSCSFLPVLRPMNWTVSLLFLRQKNPNYWLRAGLRWFRLRWLQKGPPKVQQSWFPGMAQYRKYGRSRCSWLIFELIRSNSQGKPAQQTSPKCRMMLALCLYTNQSKRSKASPQPVPQSPKIPTTSLSQKKGSTPEQSDVGGQQTTPFLEYSTYAQKTLTTKLISSSVYCLKSFNRSCNPFLSALPSANRDSFSQTWSKRQYLTWPSSSGLEGPPGYNFGKFWSLL